MEKFPLWCKSYISPKQGVLATTTTSSSLKESCGGHNSTCWAAAAGLIGRATRGMEIAWLNGCGGCKFSSPRGLPPPRALSNGRSICRRWLLLLLCVWDTALLRAHQITLHGLLVAKKEEEEEGFFFFFFALRGRTGGGIAGVRADSYELINLEASHDQEMEMGPDGQQLATPFFFWALATI